MQVANALVHGDAGRGHQRRHGRDDARDSAKTPSGRRRAECSPAGTCRNRSEVNTGAPPSFGASASHARVSSRSMATRIRKTPCRWRKASTRCAMRGRCIAQTRRPPPARTCENRSSGSGCPCTRRRGVARQISPSDGFTGHQNGLIGQTASTGARPSHPASRQRLAAVFRRVRLERPRRIRAQFARHAQCAQHRLRFLVARDDQRLAAIARAHLREHRVHVAGFGAIADGKFVFRRGDSQRADHHRGQRVREFALEHRAFAGDHAVVLAHFAIQKRRKNVRQVDLLRVAEIAAASARNSASSR